MQKPSALEIARRTRGMNQTELAKKIGKTQAMISHFESGRLRVGTRDRKKLARILKRSEDELFGETVPNAGKCVGL